MAYTRRTLQLEERIYAVQKYEKLWPIVSKRDDCADLYFQQDGAPLIMLYRFESGLMNIFQTDGLAAVVL